MFAAAGILFADDGAWDADLPRIGIFCRVGDDHCLTTPAYLDNVALIQPASLISALYASNG